MSHLVEWIGALRGGEYDQGRCHLGYEDSTGSNYCCHGVLAKIADLPEMTVMEGQTAEALGVFSNQGVDASYDHPCWDILLVSGSTTMIPDEEFIRVTGGFPPRLQTVLAQCNDSGMTFAEIADALELALVVEDGVTVAPSDDQIPEALGRIGHRLAQIVEDRGWDLFIDEEVDGYLVTITDLNEAVDYCIEWKINDEGEN